MEEFLVASKNARWEIAVPKQSKGLAKQGNIVAETLLGGKCFPV